MSTPIRSLVLGLLAITCAGALASAQTPVRTAASSDSLHVWLDSLRNDPNGAHVDEQSLHLGHQTVAAGQHLTGDIVAVRGNLDVEGTVDGDAVAILGDVILHPGSKVGGDAVAIGGHVRNDGGTVGGEMRSVSAFSTAPAAAAPPVSTARATWRLLSLALGWFVVLAVLGLLTLLLTRSNLDTVAERIRADFTRAFLVGLLGEFALLPALVLSLVVLAITVVGIVLIPFAIIGFFLAAAGLLALGFLAMSYVSGESIMERGAASAPVRRAPAGYVLLLGLSLYFALWVVGALFTWAGVLGALIRLAAAAVTWAAVTVGFGAALLSRGGTRAHAPTPGPLAPPPEQDYSWETPTPVTGVAAAPRRTPVANPKDL
ncbi:MAG TPA: hypothetical protein VF166_07405 [Gemmatimonadaceae bacterium]